MAIYDEDLIQTEDTFMGYYRQKNVILCFASMGEDNLSLIPHILDTNALIKDKNKYYYEIESIVTSFKGLNHCLNSASIYYLTDDGRLVFSKRRFIR